ncbi:unnamed protein product [Didymodactylos carnosus]|uniref:Uncharacterized protein n=1 Tax=Didymodactylos carnosus TaxID=1234261 RepID=A0A814BP07_9BILA|nr:unnamed protein product [Didymodactylos carnosus]CAF3707663.1 unnamed protein product [Didymodactylos carnosus]
MALKEPLTAWPVNSATETEFHNDRAIAAKTVPARQSNDIETQSVNISCTRPKNPDPLVRIKSMSNSAMERNYQHSTEELCNKQSQADFSAVEDLCNEQGSTR